MTIKSQASRLWIETFGDDCSYVRRFFAQYFGTNTFFFIAKDGELQAMLFAIPYEIRGVSGEKHRSFYITALAVKPKYRNFGLATGLLEATIQRLRAENQGFVFLIAASSSLISFYKKFGFVGVFSHNEEIFVGKCGGLCPKDKDFGHKPIDLVRKPEVNVPEYLALSAKRDCVVVHSARSLALYRSENGYEIFELRSENRTLSIAICRKTATELRVLDLVSLDFETRMLHLERLYTEFSLPIACPDTSYCGTSAYESPHMMLPLGEVPAPKRLFFNLLLNE